MTHRRHLDLLVLLLISVFVVSASAAVYYAMNAQSTATVSAAPVYFIAGGDSSGILNLGTSNTYAQLSLNAYPNVTLTYDQAVNLTATTAKQIRLSHVSVTPNNNASVSNFISVVFRLISPTGTEVGRLMYNNTGNIWNTPSPTSYVTINSGEEFTVKVEIKAAADASVGALTAIVIAVDVK